MRDFSLSGWHRLSEHWISDEHDREFHSIKCVIDAVRALDLEPVHVERIREAILSAIEDTKRSEKASPDHLAVLIRIWAPDLDDEAKPTQTGWEDQPDRQQASSGQGFFLIQKTVGQPEKPWRVYCRMVDVLVYGK